MGAPRFFDENGDLYCEAGGTTFRVVVAGGQRWFIPRSAWDSEFRERILDELEEAGRRFTEMVDSGVPIEDARRTLPAAAMINLEFEETFGEGDQLPP